MGKMKPENEKKFQTRSEENGLNYFETAEQATHEAAIDSTVWKISWTDESGERHRMVKNSEGKFVSESIFEGASKQ